MKITLCGSTRFFKQFEEWNARLTLAGHIVYSLAVQSTSDAKLQLSETDKRHLDLVHLAKIEESEAIFVIDVEGYIGESTRREIEWAELREKAVYYLRDCRAHSLDHPLWPALTVRSNLGFKILTPEQS